MEVDTLQKIDKIATILLEWKKDISGIYYDKFGNIQIPIFNLSLKESEFILSTLQSITDITIEYRKQNRSWLSKTSEFSIENRHLPTCIMEIGYLYALKKESIQ